MEFILLVGKQMQKQACNNGTRRRFFFIIKRNNIKLCRFSVTATGATKTITITGGSSALNDITDVTVSSPVARDSLVYDGSWLGTSTNTSITIIGQQIIVQVVTDLQVQVSLQLQVIILIYI